VTLGWRPPRQSRTPNCPRMSFNGGQLPCRQLESVQRVPCPASSVCPRTQSSPMPEPTELSADRGVDATSPTPCRGGFLPGGTDSKRMNRGEMLRHLRTGRGAALLSPPSAWREPATAHGLNAASKSFYLSPTSLTQSSACWCPRCSTALEWGSGLKRCEYSRRSRPFGARLQHDVPQDNRPRKSCIPCS